MNDPIDHPRDPATQRFVVREAPESSEDLVDGLLALTARNDALVEKVLATIPRRLLGTGQQYEAITTTAIARSERNSLNTQVVPDTVTIEEAVEMIAWSGAVDAGAYQVVQQGEVRLWGSFSNDSGRESEPATSTEFVYLTPVASGPENGPAEKSMRQIALHEPSTVDPDDPFGLEGN